MYKIIFIDDEAITLRLLEVAVDWPEYGIEIAGTAQSAEEGLRLIQETDPDLAIADICMPGMDGTEFAAEVRRVNSRIRLIFLSAYAEFEYAQKAVSLGVSEYLLKPLDETKLDALLRKLVRKIEEQERLDRSVRGYRNYVTEEEIRQELARLYPADVSLKGALRDLTVPRLRAAGGGRDALLDLLAARLRETGEEIRELAGENSTPAIVRRAKQYAKEHYREPDFSLQAAADYVGLSKNHFSRVFHLSTNVRFWDYLTQIRIREACEKLREDIPISVICEEIGYKTESYFNRKFKQLMGMTPGQYRRMFAKGEDPDRK